MALAVNPGSSLPARVSSGPFAWAVTASNGAVNVVQAAQTRLRRHAPERIDAILSQPTNIERGRQLNVVEAARPCERHQGLLACHAKTQNRSEQNTCNRVMQRDGKGALPSIHRRASCKRRSTNSVVLIGCRSSAPEPGAEPSAYERLSEVRCPRSCSLSAPYCLSQKTGVDDGYVGVVPVMVPQRRRLGREERFTQRQPGTREVPSKKVGILPQPCRREVPTTSVMTICRTETMPLSPYLSIVGKQLALVPILSAVPAWVRRTATQQRRGDLIALAR